MSSRRGETEKTIFRSDRIFQFNNEWYFSTRENTDEGPYPTRFAAQNAVENYKRVMGSSLFQRPDDYQRLVSLDLEAWI